MVSIVPITNAKLTLHKIVTFFTKEITTTTLFSGDTVEALVTQSESGSDLSGPIDSILHLFGLK
ncbi:hypothetical protein PCURB6_31220 [Paenibacillus curdlanolyticus]|nr:hypothetical protein PCURB6_31220 [Paenibacillus curdlanolyticus]